MSNLEQPPAAGRLAEATYHQSRPTTKSNEERRSKRLDWSVLVGSAAAAAAIIGVIDYHQHGNLFARKQQNFRFADESAKLLRRKVAQLRQVFFRALFADPEIKNAAEEWAKDLVTNVCKSEESVQAMGELLDQAISLPSTTDSVKKKFDEVLESSDTRMAVQNFMVDLIRGDVVWRNIRRTIWPFNRNQVVTIEVEPKQEEPLTKN